MTLLCDVEIDEWEAKNRVPLFQQKTNIWLISCLNNDNATSISLAGDIEDAFSDWFGSSIDLVAKIFDGRVKFGTADNIFKTLVVGNQFPTHLGTPVKTREDMTPIPLLAAGNVVNLLVRFDYRGTAPSIAWPVYSKGVFSRNRCPIGANVMLTAVFAPTAESPPEIFDKEVFKRASDKAKGEVSDAFQSATIPLVVLSAVIIVGGLAFLKVKK